MAETGVKSGGLFASASRIRDSFLALLHTRLELAVLELQEEKIRLIDILLRVVALFVLGNLALVTLTALVVVIFWERSGVLALIILTAIYVLAALLLWFGLLKRLNAAPPLLAETLSEFKKDAEVLKPKD